MRGSTGYERVEAKDRLKALLELVRRDWTGRDATTGDSVVGPDSAAQVPIGEDSQGALACTSGVGGVEWDERAGYEFDGIRSEVDFRRAMALEERRLRGTWGQRASRALSAIGATLRKSRVLRFLR